MILRFFIAMVWVLLVACAPSQKLSKYQVASHLEKLDKRLRCFSGMVVYDPQADKYLIEKNADRYFTPASNTKLFTFYAGWKMLGDSLPALKYAEQGDSLIFWGTGNPTLLHKKLPDSLALQFLCSQKGKKVFYADIPMRDQRLGPGWAWDDYPYYFSTEKASFPIYGNNVWIHLNGTQHKPVVEPHYFETLLDSGYDAKGEYLTIRRAEHHNRFVYQPELDVMQSEESLPFRYDTNLMLRLLKDTLHFPISSYQEKELPPAKILRSLPADSLYKHMLQPSDNFYAEQIMLMCSAMLGDTLDSKKAIGYVTENFLGDLSAPPIWEDGSGLSRYNLFTPRSIVDLLRKIHKEVPQERLFDMLPAGGRNGTLKYWYDSNEPFVFAKTGTLRNNHCLSGYLLTRKGKVLIFSMMFNHYTVPTTNVKKEMEKILWGLRMRY
ncbi:D-alanyl-D-alanine carboxypeptidase [Rapidithrix thailandica]|uniref:D-alanyl-D-alanine carboxypeptidase n=1 Tax=Rapidithrix thailandica TaxID=413964 RepID=A0AAW9S3D4_9BACT